MSSHTSSNKIDQKEYLKKYLSGDKQHKKKKKKKDKHQAREGREKVRIIDDDAVANTNEQVIDEELLLVGDDAPQIVGEYVEELVNGNEKKAKWKAIGVKEERSDEEGNVGRRNIKLESEDLWGKRAADIKLESDYLAERNNQSSKLRDRSVDNSPPRRPRNGVNRSVSPRGRGKRRNDSPKTSDRRQQYPIKKERRSRSNDMSPPRRRRQSRDLSPRRQRNKSEDNSPPRRGRKVSDDSSPPRRHKRASPSRKRNASIDNSPPRKPRKVSRDQSPVRRQRSSPNDNSPPRKNYYNSRRQSRSPSPSHRNQRNPFAQKNERANHSSKPSRRNSDQSPPRRIHSSQIDSNSFRREAKRSTSPRSVVKQEKQSPKQRRSQDLSPQRRKARRESRDTPPRWKPLDKNSRHVSPQRRRRSRDKVSPFRKWSPGFKNERSKYESKASLSPPPTHKTKQTKTLDGKKAGLQDAVSLRQENEKRRAEEDSMFAKMSKDLSGRDAEINVRSTGRKGRRARRAEEEQDEDPEVRREKEERERQKKEQYDRWGKGLKQIEDHRQKIAEFEHESNKPLARYRDDEDLERHLKEREYADDPMLAYMRQKRKDEEKAQNKPVVPKYEGPFPENRFGIRPGYRWDGVDRSNGFEKKLFNVQNERRAVQDDAYKYSVEDM